MKIKLRVIPQAKTARIIQEADTLKVYLNQPAIEGRANKQLIELLAKYYHTKKYQVKIIKGQKQRDKIVEIGEVS